MLDPHLTMNQIIALRFTSDKEFLSSCEKAANDGLASDTIKKRGRPIIIGCDELNAEINGDSKRKEGKR